MVDPTKLLQNQIMAAQRIEEESKNIALNVEQVDSSASSKPAFMSMAADSEPAAEPENLSKKASTGMAGRDLDFDQLPFAKHKSYTPMPFKRGHAKSAAAQNAKKPFILGICGGPSSGMSTVATNIRQDLQKSGISTTIVSLVNFYYPLRGNLRKSRSRAGSLVEEENKQEVMGEIQAINEAVDFDDPKQIDFDLLIVS